MNKPAISLVSAKQAEQTGPLKLDEFLPHRLNLCATGVSTALSKVYSERYQIGVPEWRCIVILGEFGRLTAKEIGVHGQMHKTKVSRAVAVLEKRNFVTRRANAADLREAFLSLTTEGRAVYDDVAPQAVQFVSQLIATIDPCERDVFCRVLKQITDRTSTVATDVAKTGKPG